MRSTIKYSAMVCVVFIALMSAAFHAEVIAGTLSAARSCFEASYQKYLSLIKADSASLAQEQALRELVAAREAYVKVLADEAARASGVEAAKLRAELERIRNLSFQIRVTAAADSNANGQNLKKAPLPVSGGAQKPLLTFANSRAASIAGSFGNTIKNSFARIASAVSSAVTFVSGYAGDFFAAKYDETKIPREVAVDPAASTKGFTTGVNFPWVKGKYGWDVCVHQSWGKGFDEAAIESAFAKFKRKKFKVVRWFLYCNGVAEPKMDGSGRFMVPGKEFFDNFETVMRLAGKYDLQMVWSLLDFGWFKKDSANFVKYSMIAKDPVLLENFIQSAVVPLVKKYADDKAIFAWEVINEPEWVTAGVSYPGAPGSMSVDELRDLVKKITQAIHAAGSRPVTVGSANPKWLSLYVGTGIDIYQAHYYDKGSRIAKNSFSATKFKKKYNLKNQVILGEFASKGSRYTIAQYINMAREAGYDGAWVWGYYSEDESTDPSAIDGAEIRY